MMSRRVFIAAVLLCGLAAVYAVAEVPVHMSASAPLSLQKEQTQPQPQPLEPRFAQQQSEDESDAEGESEGESESDSESSSGDYDRNWEWDGLKATSAREEWVTKSVDRSIPGYKPKLDAEYDTISEMQQYKMDREYQHELNTPDTVIEESDNTMTQSAHCLMYCANSVGLCTKGNPKGCACAAGCQCNRGDPSATCCQHCHPANPSTFVYGYHDTAHFAPHIWPQPIGDVLSNYQLVRECLAGCAHRGKCKPRFCPRHPKGGYKCNECRRMAMLPRSGKPTGKYVKYSCGSKPARKRGVKRPQPPRVRRTVTHHHDTMDSWGHVTHHHHHHHTEYVPNYRFAMAEADQQQQATDEVAGQDEVDVHMADEDPVVAEADVAAEDQQQEGEGQSQSQSLLESESESASEGPQYPYGYGYSPSVTTRRHRGHTVTVPVALQPRLERVPRGQPADPLAQKIDCNYYDCTKADFSAMAPVGSLNPVEPYVNRQEPRTTSFSTVPDMLRPVAHTDVVITP